MFTATALTAIEIYICVFANSPGSFSYNRTEQTLTVNSGELETSAPSIQTGVQFSFVSSGRYALNEASGKTLYFLELTGQGTDGTSQRWYPFEVITASRGAFPRLGAIGGCSSTSLPFIEE